MIGSDSDEQRSAWFWRIVLLILTVVTFLPVLGAGFLNWDDNRHLIDNPLLRLDRIFEFWRRPYFGLYVPVTYSIWTLLAAVSGTPLNPLPFHLLNLLVHAANVLLVFGIARSIVHRDLPAALGAACFAIHPLQVEAVAWVSGFRDVLGGFLALVAIWQYLRAGQEKSKRRLSIATIAFVLALLAKPTTIVVPLICLAIDRRRWRITLFWLAVSLPILVITRFAQPASPADAPHWRDRIIVGGDAASFYLQKLFLPLSFCVDYGHTPAMVLGQPVWLSVIRCAIPIMLALLLFIWRKRNPAMALGGLIAAIGLLPTLGIVSFDFQQYSTVADRYAYLAMVGVGLTIAGVTANAGQKMVPALWIVVVILSARSLLQTSFWHDGVTLFTHALEVNPRSSLACSELASTALDAGRAEEAQQWAEQAVERRSDWPLPYVTYGLAAMHRDPPDMGTAERAFRTALVHDPKFGSALTNLSALLAQQGRFDEATGLCQRAIAVDPSDVSAHINLGNILASQGRRGEAAAEYRAALAIAPGNRQATANLAAIASPKP